MTLDETAVLARTGELAVRSGLSVMEALAWAVSEQGGDYKEVATVMSEISGRRITDGAASKYLATARRKMGIEDQRRSVRYIY